MIKQQNLTQTKKFDKIRKETQQEKIGKLIVKKLKNKFDKFEKI